jgi:hypothetical protein
VIRNSKWLKVSQLCVLVAGAGLCSHSWADSSATQTAEAAAEDGEIHESTLGVEHHHKNHIALFVGSTEAEVHEGDKEDRDFTLGVDYERRLTKLIGMGGLYDWVAEGRREFLIGMPVFFHPFKASKFQIAPCVQRIREDKEIKYVTRIGFSWGFELSKTTISPEIFYDITSGQDFIVFGVAFGWGF